MDTNNLLGTGALLAGAGTIAWGLLRSLKDVPLFFFNRIKRKLFYTVRIYQSDELFEMLEYWLSFHHQKLYRDVEAVSETQELNEWVTLGITPSSTLRKLSGKTKITTSIKYKQEDNTFFIKYKGKKVFIQKTKEKLDKAQHIKDLYFRKYVLSGWRAKDIITALLEDVLILEASKTDHESVKVYAHNSYGEWYSTGRRTVKNLNNTILSTDTKQLISNDIETFLHSQEWYKQVCIPYKRGYCFYGPPGTGKTTLALALASHTGREIYCLNLNAAKNDATLQSILSSDKLSEGAILLIEDIDKTFSGRDNTNDKSEVSFSCFINSLDGAFYKPGLITILTTNHIDKLDEALLRTGRTDLKIEIPLPTDKEISAYMSIFYSHPVEILGHFSLKMSDVQELCLSNRHSLENAKKQIYFNKKTNGIAHENTIVRHS